MSLLQLNKYILNLDEFKILRELGDGSYGRVFLVENIVAKKLYAAKVCKKVCINPKDQEAFFIEVGTLISTSNPAILGILGFSLYNFSKEPYPTIIIDYMPNGSLAEILEKCRLGRAPNEWTNTKRYIALLGIAIGVKYLHSMKIVHRDLKPLNVLLDDKYYPYICDFGCSKILDELDSKKLMETETESQLYMAPEILTGSKYTHKVDVYSYSITAYEIITKKWPIPEGENSMLFIHKVPKGKRPDISPITNHAHIDFLQKCWSKDPNKRPSFEQIVDMIKDEKFYSSFNVNIYEINKYLSLFPNESPLQTKRKKEVPPPPLTPTTTPIQQKHIPSYNICIVGSRFSQKTEFILSFVNNHFDNVEKESILSICSSCSRIKIHTDCGECYLNISDTPSQEQYRSMNRIYYRNSDGIIIVANGDCLYQFNEVKSFFSDVEYFIPSTSLIFIAFTNFTSDHAVTVLKQIRNFAEANNCPFVPFSIDDKKSVFSVFNKLAINLMNSNPPFNEEDNKRNCSIY